MNIQPQYFFLCIWFGPQTRKLYYYLCLWTRLRNINVLLFVFICLNVMYVLTSMTFVWHFGILVK